MVKLSAGFFLPLLLLAIISSNFVVMATDDSDGGYCCSGGGRDTNACEMWCIYDQQEQDFCYAKYIPGGDKIILEPIEAPTATLKDYSNAHEATQAGFVVELVEPINDITPKNVWKFSAKFATGLSIFGSVIGGVGSFLTPTPNDIIDACNKAIKELTDEVNDQFINMQSYIDQAILQAQADALKKFLSYFQTKFTNCIYEPSESLLMDCLADSERDIHASSSIFMRFKEQFKDSEFSPSNEDIKHMEMEFITFMSYATLRTVNLLIVYDTSNNMPGSEAEKQTCRFLTALETELTDFIDYTTKIYNAILDAHNQSADYDYFLNTVEKTWSYEDHNQGATWHDTEGHYAFQMSTFLPPSDDYRCKMSHRSYRTTECHNCQTRYPRSKCSEDGGGISVSKCWARERAYDKYKYYTANMVESAKNYWKPQTIDRMGPWKEIVSQVAGKRAGKGCDAIEAESIQKEEL